MKRRSFIAGAAVASLARPAIAAGTRPLIFVPQSNLTVLDPVWTAATVTRNYTLMVYETLYARDIDYRPQPLMVAGHVIEDDGKRWTMTLRDGLLFHDGTPVLARDCVASLQRWLKRDQVSTTFASRVAALEAKDDRTLVWRLIKPFPTLPAFLSKAQPQPVIMPERLAKTDPYQQVSEIVGCGPFRFVTDEYVSGTRAVFAKFDRYTPRQEPPSYVAGGHQVKVERVEWQVIPDPATAANALTAGEVDWLELPQPDLVPMLKSQRGVTTGLLDIYGTYGHLRPNHIQGPTANPGVRRAMLAAINQKDEMIAVMGEDPATWRVPVGYFIPGSRAANDAGMEAVNRLHSVDEVKAMLDKAGYAGERVAFMHPTDQLAYHAMCIVAVDAFRKVGLNIDDQLMDWGTILQRRNSKEPLDKGGWSMFPGGSPGGDNVDPLMEATMRSNGPKAWVGWPDDPQLEAALDGWIDAPDEAERRRLERVYQAAAFNSVPTIPVGQYLPHAAWRSNVTGQLKGSAPVFWGVEKG
jgi:peptide/nickel transport system substrate-binding protein